MFTIITHHSYSFFSIQRLEQFKILITTDHAKPSLSSIYPQISPYKILDSSQWKNLFYLLRKLFWFLNKLKFYCVAGCQDENKFLSLSRWMIFDDVLEVCELFKSSKIVKTVIDFYKYIKIIRIQSRNRIKIEELFWDFSRNCR